MRSKHPVQAKSTPNLLRILPRQFKMVNDKTSNGYKYTNLLYGAEIDECNDRVKTLYDSLFSIRNSFLLHLEVDLFLAPTTCEHLPEEVDTSYLVMI
jgi:hypothetical protein